MHYSTSPTPIGSCVLSSSSVVSLRTVGPNRVKRKGHGISFMLEIMFEILSYIERSNVSNILLISKCILDAFLES